MQDCDQMLELISAKLDGELTAEEAARLGAHLEACPACRALLNDFSQLHAAMPREAVPPPANLKDGVLEQIRAEKVVPLTAPVKRKIRWKSWASLAAALALVLVGGSTLRQWSGSDAIPVAEGKQANQPAVQMAVSPEMVEDSVQTPPQSGQTIYPAATPAATPAPEPVSTPVQEKADAEEGAPPALRTAGKSTASQPQTQNEPSTMQAEHTPVPSATLSAAPTTTPSAPESTALPNRLTQQQAKQALQDWLGRATYTASIPQNSEEAPEEEPIVCLGLSEDETVYRFQVTAGDHVTVYLVPLDGSAILEEQS